ncbi:MAG: calcium/sodium antiporter [Calditrichaceae bacterium]
MPLYLNFALLLFGFLLLIKGADLLVEGSASLAVRFSISPMVIGLTIVAFGTSSPELVVNIIASLKGNADLSFGNIIGSNIVNILLILGIAGLINPISTHRNTVWREIPFALLGSLVLIFLCNDIIFDHSENILSRSEGIVLLFFFIVFLIYTFAISKVETDDTEKFIEMNTAKTVIYILLGLSGLFFGGQFVVNNSIDIARYFNVSDRIIGLTIVAIGTSLPELFTSAVAAYKGQSDIAMGNILGSNIFNIFFILAISALIRPLPFNSAMNLDLMVLITASFLLFFTMFTGKKRTLDRWEAVLFLVIYVVYTIYLISRA